MDHVAHQATQGPGGVRERVDVDGPDERRGAALDGEFPPPPWPGTNLLRPITSRAQLQRIGAELRNCLETPTWLTRSVLKVLNGTDYFYERRGDPAAVLRFVRVQDVGWYLEQIEGFGGEAVSDTPVMCACEPNGFDSGFLEKVLSAVT